MSHTPHQITEQLHRLDQEFEMKRKEALAPARTRLDDIQRQRDELDKEESYLLSILGEKSDKPKRTRRRMTSQRKKEVLSRFVRDGHIRENADMSSELRAALSDEGFNPNDFRKIDEYLPSGWSARKNGARGTAAKTTFLRT